MREIITKILIDKDIDFELKETQKILEIFLNNRTNQKYNYNIRNNKYLDEIFKNRNKDTDFYEYRLDKINYKKKVLRYKDIDITVKMVDKCIENLNKFLCLSEFNYTDYIKVEVEINKLNHIRKKMLIFNAFNRYQLDNESLIRLENTDLFMLLRMIITNSLLEKWYKNDKTKVVKKFNNNVVTLEKDNKKQGGQILTLEKGVNEKYKEVESLKESIRDKNQEVENLMIEISELKENLSNKESIITNKNLEISNYMERVEQLEANINAKDYEIQKYNQEIDTCNEIIGIDAISEFIKRLNSANILDQFAKSEKLFIELKRKKFKLPEEVESTPILIRQYMQFIRNYGINEIDIREVCEISSKEAEKANYIGEGFKHVNRMKKIQDMISTFPLYPEDIYLD